MAKLAGVGQTFWSTGFAPLADVGGSPDWCRMQCYYVLVHGTLEWTVSPPSDGVSQPAGFYCHRYVLAADEGRATEIAFGRVRSNLNKGGGWLSNGDALLMLTAEEVRVAPFYKLLKPDNRGHTFYEEDDGS